MVTRSVAETIVLSTSHGSRDATTVPAPVVSQSRRAVGDRCAKRTFTYPMGLH